MRATNIVLSVGLLLTGCAAGAGGSRGVTLREHAGETQVIFTNATPGKMCELHMSYEDNRDMGDNWLPANGLPSGKSIEFKIRPGKYQATWSTCSQGKGYFAGTLIGETGIGVDGQQTQLFAYVADTVAPTKRAPVLGRDYHVVKFSGQPVGPIDRSAPAPTVDAFAVAEASLTRGKNNAPPKVDPGSRFEAFSAKDMIDPDAKRAAKAKKGKRAKVRPSLDRKHDVAAANVGYRAR